MARSDWIDPQELGHLLAALMPPNRLALEVSAATGLRIADVLHIRSEQLSGADGRMTVRERKTGKARRIRIPADLLERMARQQGRVYVWEGRASWLRPRTRQAVYKDLKRAARLYRIPAGTQISPHSARKTWAVGIHQRHGLARVQALLGHCDEAVTILYAMADQLTARKHGRM
jgi:integrase